ncbi:hypothetical protein CERSUDRAFT_77683 [Gelatoporia subvermispora B]|uniref:Uncharacterized protein n=1 Tax=Ceriporiopsis subvermispora (strain B) TaxID=914234 RepID=M2QJ13_CERS8|nr:hypothetical protein CERSUDRAFT_77683 [Gelatoporia subvermispora B]
MSGLSESIDRLSQLARSTRSNALASAPDAASAGPFTRAVLHMPLGDLIRDIDPAEIGLFTLVQPASAIAADPDVAAHAPSEIVRVQFTGATPLKRPPAPRPGTHDQRAREHEPEVYADAALRYLDRYQSIRPMPRASEQAMRIAEQLQVVREDIRVLSDKLQRAMQQAAPAPPVVNAATTLAEEECRIQGAQARIAELKKRKAALIERRQTPHTTPRPPASDVHEESFWATPGTAARTLHFGGDSLLSEQVDLANVSLESFATPLPAKSYKPPRDLEMPPVVPEASPELPEPATPVQAADETVSAESPPPEPSSPTPQPLSQDEPKEQGIRVTHELELIVSRIWATIGELLMPGHALDVSPPRATETIAHLKTLASATPAPASPLSALSSIASAPAPGGAPTAQQILTAHMLLALLATPGHSLSLNTLKNMLTPYAKGLPGQGPARPVYGCVAKKLLRIDRGGGEQIVRFDL